MKEQPQNPLHREPIAIVGMSCRFPGASNPDKLWDLVSSGKDAITEYDQKRGAPLDEALTPDGVKDSSIATIRGGYLSQIDRFDADFFGISPREAESLDPQQRLLLELTWEALEDAGIPADRVRGTRTGVFMGLWSTDYEQCLHEAGAGTDIYATTGNGRYAASGRVSFAFDFRGPSITLDTACSTSLVAVHMACRSIQNGESEFAIAGAANLIVRPELSMAYTRARILSPGGSCKFGDESADGYVRSEGAAVLVLKPLRKALADADPIHALVLGGAVSSHGAGSGLLVRPAQGGLEAMLRQAWADAAVSADEIGYIEAHGPGTRAGDPVELGAIGQVLKEQGRTGECLVGSVKTNLGHSEAASGLASLIKTVQAIRHGAIPPTLNFHNPNADIPWKETPVRIPTSLLPWPEMGAPRTAGVNSFGITGTTAHIVLREGPRSAAAASSSRSAYLLPLSARTPAGLKQLAATCIEEALARPDRLADLCYTASVRRAHHGHRAIFVGANLEEVRQEVAAFVAGEESPFALSGKSESGRGRIAFVFPGQGSQWTGMGRELFKAEPVFRGAIERCHAAIARIAGWSLLDLFHSGAAEDLERIDRIQPLLFAIQVALTELWFSLGVLPDAVVGHSMGEVAAAVAAGALSLEDGAAVICLRSRLMGELREKGGMAVLGLKIADADARIAAFGGRLSVAASNSPVSTVVSGDAEAIRQLVLECESSEIFCRAVRVDVASHSAHMDAIVDLLEDGLQGIAPKPPVTPLYSTVTGKQVVEPLGPSYWRRNLREPVMFAPAIGTLLDAGFDAFVEVSPHPTLVSAVEETARLAGKQIVATGSLSRRGPEIKHVLRGLGQLHVAGHPVRWNALHPQGGNCVPLPAYPWQRERFWFRENAERSAKTGRKRGGALQDHIEVAARPGLHIYRVDAGSIAAPEALKFHGTATTPISACLSLLFEAGASLAGEGPAYLADVAIAGAILPAEKSDVQLSFELQSADEAVFSIRKKASGAWIPVMSGSFFKGVPPGTPAIEVRANSAPETAFYEDAASRGCEFAPELRILTEVREERMASTAAASLDGTRGAAIEAMLQLVTCAADKTFRPVFIERITLDAVAAGDARIAGTAAVNDPVTSDRWSANVEARTAEGVRAASLIGVRLELAPDKLALTPAGFLYEERWALEERSETGARTNGRWIVVSQEDAACADLVHQLEMHSQKVSVASSAAEVAASEVQRAAGVLLVVPTAKAAPPLRVSGAAGVVKQLAETARSIAQTAAEMSGNPPRLWVVTHGIEAVDNDLLPPGSVEQGGIRGFVRVVQKELPELRCTRADLPAEPAAADMNAFVQSVLHQDSEDQLAFRGGRRYTSRLHSIAEETTPEWPVRSGAAYLITGGSGGLGILMAQHLVGRGAGRVILIGRSLPNARGIEAIQALEQQGARIDVRRVDVTDRARLGQLFESLAAEGVELAGVLHAAAVTDDVLVRDLTDDSIRSVMAPKVEGAWNLHELTASMPLDFFVMFSSIAAVIPQPGQASYAAANSYLDYLAAFRRSAGLPALAIQWGPWSATGIWTEGMKKSVAGYRRQGIGRIPAAAGIECLGRLLSSQCAAALVAPIDAPLLAASYEGTAAPSLVRGFAAAAPAAAAAPDQDAGLLAQIANAPAGRHADVVESHLKRLLGSVLRIGSDRIESDRPLGELGLDSMMGLEFVRRLGKDLETRLPASLVYNYPTVARMTGHLLAAFAPAAQPGAESVEVPELVPAGAAGNVNNLTDAQALAELMGDSGL